MLEGGFLNVPAVGYQISGQKHARVSTAQRIRATCQGSFVRSSMTCSDPGLRRKGKKGVITFGLKKDEKGLG